MTVISSGTVFSVGSVASSGETASSGSAGALTAGASVSGSSSAANDRLVQPNTVKAITKAVTTLHILFVIFIVFMFPFTSFAKSISKIQHIRNSILQLFQSSNGILNKIESFTGSIKTGNPEFVFSGFPVSYF